MASDSSEQSSDVDQWIPTTDDSAGHNAHDDGKTISPPMVHNQWLHPLTKTHRSQNPLVEVTPFVFQDRLYLLENWQAFFTDMDPLH